MTPREREHELDRMQRMREEADHSMQMLAGVMVALVFVFGLVVASLVWVL